MSLRGWLDERTGYRRGLAALEAPIPGGPSALRTLGPVLGFLLLLELVTGLVMAMYYSPSTSDAWGSVAYLEDQVAMGSFVRGLHRWGLTAIVLVIAMHLVTTAVRGAYRRPRELTWWLGIGLFVLCVAYSVTGFVLRWDQYGYWATKVELGYVERGPGGRPLIGALQGGNDFGNLTLTRFYALHVVLLPVVTGLLLWGHRKLARHHGPAVADGARARGRTWPDQSLRNLIAMVVVLALLIAWTMHRGGAGLEAPADPTAAFDARPQWYLRPMFELQKYVPASVRLMVALGLPALIVGGLALLPLIDRRAVRTRVMRWGVIGGMAALGLFLSWSILISYRHDAQDAGLHERAAAAAKQAARARRLAAANGVPEGGGVAVYTTAPFYVARTAWARECAACHEGDDRKGPLIGPGWNDRTWIRGLLLDPSHDAYFGRTKLVKAEDAMPKTVAKPADLDALVEMVYAESGAKDVDAVKAARGQVVFDSDDDDGDGEDDDGSCTACHERTGSEASTGPNLAGRGSPAYLAAFIRNPAEPRFFGARDEMKGFADELTAAELAAIVEYLGWLRDASAADVAKLDE